MKNIGKRKSALFFCVFGCLLLVVGVSWGIFNYSKAGNNSSLVLGDIYMSSKENSMVLNKLEPMTPSEGIDKGSKYSFSVEGYNTSNKDIYYGVYLNYGSEETGKNRFKDADLMMYLTETKNGETKAVYGPGSVKDFNDKMIYANTINAATKKEEKVEINYELTVWLSDNIIITDTEESFEGKNVYTTSEYANSYASIDVKVYGDFEEKNIKKANENITATTISTNKDYEIKDDIKDATKTDEDVKIVIITDKEAKLYITNLDTGVKKEETLTLKNNLYTFERVETEKSRYSYYFEYLDSTISQIYYYNINIQKYENINKPTSVLCSNQIYNGETQLITSIETSNYYTISNNKQTDVGEYQVVVKLKDGFKWTDETENDITFTCRIEKKDLTITPNELSKEYGENDPVLTYTYTGNVDGETPKFTGTLQRETGEKIGSYLINKGTLELTDNGKFKKSNYNLVFAKKDVKFTINEKIVENLTITLEYTETTYDGTEKKPNVVVKDGSKTLTSGTDYDLIYKNNINAGEATITVTFKGSYTGSSEKKFTIKKKNTVVPTAANYCNTLTYNGVSQTLTKASGEGYTFSNTTGTDAKDYTVTATLKANYVWSDGTNTNKTFICSIGKKAVTVKAESSSKTYDGSALTKTSGCESSTGLITNHAATCTNTGSITNAGSTTNTLSGVVIKNGTADVTSNYNITKQNGTLTVNKKTVAVTWTTGTYTYNGSDQGPTPSAISGVTGETINLTRTTGKNAGNYTSTASCSSVTGGNATCNNYTLSSNTKVFTINKATPSLTLSATSGSVNAGSSITFTEKANLAGNFGNVSGTTGVATVSPASYTSVAANTAKTVTVTGVSNGSSTITVTFTPTDTTNYNTKTATYTVTGYKVASLGSCNTLTYNGTSQTLAGNGTGVSYTNNSGTNATSYTVTATATSGYRFSDNTTSKTLSCSIGKKILTVTPNALSKNVGASDPTLTYTYTGNVSGQTPKFTGTLQRTSGESVGKYPINKGTLALADNGTFLASNYNFVFSGTTVNFEIKSLTHTITYTKGTGVSSISKTTDTCTTTGSNTSCTVTAPSITVSTGYGNAKFGTSSSSQGSISAGSIITLTGNATYYAIALPNTYIVTYDARGGTLSGGKTLTNLIVNGSFEKNGNNWTLEQGANIVTEDKYSGSKALKLNSSSTLTPTAKQTLSITSPIVNHKYYGRNAYKSISGLTNNDSRFEFIYGDATNARLTFGWKNDTGGSWKILSSIQEITASTYTDKSWFYRTFSVIPSTNSYVDDAMMIDLTSVYGSGSEKTVTYLDKVSYFDGTTSLLDKSINYNTTLGTLPTPSKSGYEFLGWFTSPEGGTRISSSTTYNYANDTFFYAHWKDTTTPTVNYSVSGGTYTSTKSVVITPNDNDSINYYMVHVYKDGTKIDSKSTDWASTPTFTVNLDSAGNWKIYTKVYDNAGNLQNQSPTSSEGWYYQDYVINLTVSYTVRHYQMNNDGESYTLVETVTGSGPIGSSVTGAVKTYDNFTSPPAQTITLSATASNNVINYYYTRNCYGSTCDYCTKGSQIGSCLYNSASSLGLWNSGIATDTTHTNLRYIGTKSNEPNNYVCVGSTTDCTGYHLHRIIGVFENDHRIKVIYPTSMGNNYYYPASYSKITYAYTKNHDGIRSKVQALLTNANLGYNTVISGTTKWSDMMESVTKYNQMYNVLWKKTATEWLDIYYNGRESYSATYTDKIHLTAGTDVLLSTGSPDLTFEVNYDTIRTSWLSANKKEWIVDIWNTTFAYFLGGDEGSGSLNGKMCSNSEKNSSTYTYYCKDDGYTGYFTDKSSQTNGYYRWQHGYRPNFEMVSTTLFCGGSGTSTDPYKLGYGSC